METKTASQPPQLKRELGIFGAVMMGLGSIVGTGVFVSIGIAAGIAGPAVLVAIIIGALVAIFNGLNSAQLAANHPVSGGTYEYGYQYLNAPLGFTAGWMFLLAKSASAATAALGFAGYCIEAFGLDTRLLIPLAFAATVFLTVIIAGGIKRSNIINSIIVSITLSTLAFFVFAGLLSLDASSGERFTPFLPESDSLVDTIRMILYASALMFVAYTGYGRIATLGEEVKEPRRTIPLAIITSLIVIMILYISVALTGIATAGAPALSNAVARDAAPLEAAARTFDITVAPAVIAIGAITAMLGVLLNLILGLSRVLLAMGRRHDMPSVLARLDQDESTPYIAVYTIGAFIACITLIGDVRITWSFSAFTVLIYYALTNLAALQLKPEKRLFPRWVTVAGLTSCLFLAFWVEPPVWIIGLILIGVGLVWHVLIAPKIFGRVSAS
ncbi:MAG: APC family permease [Chloroflexota bacterium]